MGVGGDEAEAGLDRADDLVAMLGRRRGEIIDNALCELAAIDPLGGFLHAPGLDAREVEEILDDATDAERFGIDTFGQAVGHRGVLLELEGLGEQSERAHRCLELVRHVGDEVTTDVLEASTL